MLKTILITGATDGIGLETAKILVEQGHHILLHGRSPEKLHKVSTELSKLGTVDSSVADLSDLQAVRSLAKAIVNKHDVLDVLINNAGVFQVADAVTAGGYDVRFMVNTIAPYLLTKELLPLLGDSGRVINLSSAAQEVVDLNALEGMGKARNMEAMSAYSQSKLAITMWTHGMANTLGKSGPVIVAVNPGSLLGSKMVKEGFGIVGKDLRIGADILVQAALSDDFADATGKYFDNDIGSFASPDSYTLNPEECQAVINSIEVVINKN